jgi:hypothetical protein
MPTIKISFGDRLSNLYDVGYLTVDVFQLISFAEALAEGDRKAVARWFGENARPFNRYAAILEKRAQKSRIIDFRRGSVYFYVEVASSLAACICALLTPYIQHRLDNNRNEFSIEMDDLIVQRAIEAFRAGAFGKGSEAIDNLSEYLAKNDRSLLPLGRNAYAINRVLQRYSSRVVRTLRRP